MLKKHGIKWILILCLILVTIWVVLDTKTCQIISNPTQKFNCVDYEALPRQEIHGKYVIFRNFIRPTRTFACLDAVTFSTHSDLVYLQYLDGLARRFDGPISLTVYAPGNDFFAALKLIAYLKKCKTQAIKKLVTFHLVFDLEHMPRRANRALLNASSTQETCDKAPIDLNQYKSYRSLANLDYPMNLARNIAKQEATTHFLMNIDIELTPSREFSKNFVNFIVRKPNVINRFAPVVFVLPTFEIERNTTIPDNKKHLEELSDAKRVHIFLEKICPKCHKIPEFDFSVWIRKETTGFIGVFATRKKRKHWMPFFVGTKSDPFFDERFYLGHYGDRLTQLYIMCLQEYNFMILDDAFLVHRPGRKTFSIKTIEEWTKARPLLDNITKELDIMYKPQDFFDSNCELETPNV